MKKILLILIVFLFVIILKAQKVFSVDYINQADVKVFVEDYESRASGESSVRGLLGEALQ